ncbi:ABM domain-containing protein [Pleurotus pulmonarius]
MPIVEFLTINTSKAYVEDPTSSIQPLAGVLKKTGGCVAVYHGIQEEGEKTKGQIAIIWETYEDHAALMNDPSYPLVGEAFGVLLAPGTALSAPATEIAIFTLKEGGDPQALSAALRDLATSIDAADGAHPPCCWGNSRERGKKFFLLVGWDSSKAHIASASSRPAEVKAVTDRLSSLADVAVVHTAFSKA